MQILFYDWPDVPEKHVQVYVFAPRTREAKTPLFHALLTGAKEDDPFKLEDKYYRYGIKPEWLQVHRIFNDE